MPWVKRFGGPGTSVASKPSAGVITRGDQLTKWTQHRTRGDPGHEPIGEQSDQPRSLGHDQERSQRNNPGRYEPGRNLVDRVGKSEEISYVHRISINSDQTFHDSDLSARWPVFAAPAEPLAQVLATAKVPSARVTISYVSSKPLSVGVVAMVISSPRPGT